jgi:hypothetical protein
MGDIGYLVLKLVGSLVAAVAGVIGIISDLRVDKNGDKVLSKGGYAVLVCLIMGTLVSMTTDYHKERSDAAASQKASERLALLAKDADSANLRLEAANTKLDTSIEKSQTLSGQLNYTEKNLESTQTSIAKNSAATSSVLNQARRLQSPIPALDSLRMSAAIVVRGDEPAAQPYLVRLQRDHPLILGMAKEEDSNYPSVHRPEEARLAALREFDVMVMFHINSKTYDPNNVKFDFLADASCSDRVNLAEYTDGKVERWVEAQYPENKREHDKFVKFTCLTTQWDKLETRFPFSWVDLEGSKASVCISFPNSADDGKGIRYELEFVNLFGIQGNGDPYTNRGKVTMSDFKDRSAAGGCWLGTVAAPNTR